jgi:hypothetical protein
MQTILDSISLQDYTGLKKELWGAFFYNFYNRDSILGRGMDFPVCNHVQVEALVCHKQNLVISNMKEKQRIPSMWKYRCELQQKAQEDQTVWTV